MSRAVERVHCRALLLASVATMSLAVRADAQEAAGPVSYIMTVTADSGQGPKTVAQERVRAAHGMMRMEVEMASGPATQATSGMYVLMADGSDSTTTVLPAQRMMMTRAGFAQVIPPGLVTMTRTGAPTYDVADLGDGPVIDGLPTHHYRVTLDATVDVAIEGAHCLHPVHSVTDIWNATGVTLPNLFMKRFVSGLMENMGTTPSPDVASMVRAKTPPGVTLRSESVEKGVTRRMEVSDISHDPIDASVFERPAGFTTMDGSMMSGMMDNPAVRARMAEVLRARMCAP